MKKYIYETTSLNFNPDNEKQRIVHSFLDKLERKKTLFVADLVYSYLLSKNVTDVDSLSKADADAIAGDLCRGFGNHNNMITSPAPATMSSNMDASLFNSFFNMMTQMMANNATIPQPAQASVSNNNSTVLVEENTVSKNKKNEAPSKALDEGLEDVIDDNNGDEGDISKIEMTTDILNGLSCFGF